MLYEFSPEMRVILADFSGAAQLITTIADLLPHGFGPDKLAAG